MSMSLRLLTDWAKPSGEQSIFAAVCWSIVAPSAAAGSLFGARRLNVG